MTHRADRPLAHRAVEHLVVLGRRPGLDHVAVLGDVLDDRLGLLGLVAEIFRARGTVWLTICIEPPPTSFLNLTSARSGSTPVVSQSIIRPIVPVGASRLA